MPYAKTKEMIKETNLNDIILLFISDRMGRGNFEKHKKEVAERARVYAIVKKMNKDNKKKKKKHQTKESNKTKRKPVRFPGI